jgi:hypothetical protein
MQSPFFRTASDIDHAIKLGTTTESQFLDFKHSAGPEVRGPKVSKVDPQKEMCRDVTQFANHLGGCLLIGIREGENANKVRVADGFLPIENPDVLRGWIEQALSKYCVPATFSHEINIIEHPQGPLLAVNVPPSRLPVVLWDQSAIEAVSRTSHGKKYLNPDDLERLRMHGSRAAKIAFDDAANKVTNDAVELVGGVLRLETNTGRWIAAQFSSRLTIGHRGESTFELRIPLKGKASTPILNIPYGLLRECWVNASGELAVLLDVHVIWRDERLTFSPTLPT